MKVAIVYDRVNKWGGAERVLLALHKIFPDAPLYTSIYDKKNVEWANVFPKIYTTFLQKIPIVKNWHEGFGWLMPLAFEQFNFDEYDLVISVTSESAKGIITKPGTLHICYMLTPIRYLWSHYDFYFKNPILKFISKPIVSYLKFWDKTASQRPDKIISISTEVQERVKKYYNRNSEIIFPPVKITKVSRIIHPRGVHKNYYLYVGRLVGYKKVDLLVRTFNKLNKKLVIVGVGSQAYNLKLKACGSIKFAGQVSDEKLINYYLHAKALIMPQEEDFGIVAVEAQSHGIPVIAYGKGGALDTVVKGKTGLHFKAQTVASLTKAIEKFEKMSFNRERIIANAKKFDFKIFQKRLQRSLVRLDSSWWRWD